MRALGWVQSPRDETEMREACQEATKYELHMFRFYIQIRSLLQRNEDPVKLNTLFEDGVAILDESQLLFGTFFETCISVFTNFSKKAQAASGMSRMNSQVSQHKLIRCSAFIVMFWVLGALTFTDQVHVAHKLGYFQTGCELLSKADQHRTTAIRYMIDITKIIAKINDHGRGHVEISKGSNTKIPLISHHANFNPVIFVLVLTIEAIIERNTKAVDYIRQNMELSSESSSMDDWIPSIKPVLTCLLDMDVTVAGSNMARQAFQKLAAAHSDILMDCWDVEDDPEFVTMI